MWNPHGHVKRNDQWSISFSDASLSSTCKLFESVARIQTRIASSESARFDASKNVLRGAQLTEKFERIVEASCRDRLRRRSPAGLACQLRMSMRPRDRCLQSSKRMWQTLASAVGCGYQRAISTPDRTTYSGCYRVLCKPTGCSHHHARVWNNTYPVATQSLDTKLQNYTFIAIFPHLAKIPSCRVGRRGAKLAIDDAIQ
jgi:hypothetical protein